MEAQLSVSASAQPSTVSLLVSNPASRAAETAFNIVAGQAVTAPPSESVEPPKPAVPATPPAPPTLATPAAPAALAPEVKPSAPTTSVPPTAPPGPEVTTVEPTHVSVGFDVDLKITGKNFVQGTKVSFANPGIRVMRVISASSTELTVHIKVAQDATTGVASIFVINPDDREVETPFEVTRKVAAAPLTPASPATPPAPGSPDTQRYAAFHLGNPAEILQVHGKVKGALVVSSDTIKYQEDGKTLINISLTEIREIKTSSAFPDTFHITLNSGKTLHFAPASLRPSDARNLVDSLRKALPQ